MGAPSRGGGGDFRSASTAVATGGGHHPSQYEWPSGSMGTTGTATALGFTGTGPSGLSSSPLGASATPSTTTSSSTSSSQIWKDPSLLFARGYTARFLGANIMAASAAYNAHDAFHASNASPSSAVVSILSPEEIEKDLRHMQAYQQACQRYHQQYYAAMNRASLQQQQQQQQAGDAAAKTKDGKGGDDEETGAAAAIEGQLASTDLAATPATTPALPVRIDPEEEKRVAVLRKRIARAESIREDLEQQYVSLRAHYVHTCRQAAATARLQRGGQWMWLQQTAARTATVTGLLRARSQMCRDVLAALRHRQTLLHQQQDGLDDKEKAAQDQDAAMIASLKSLREGGQGASKNNMSNASEGMATSSSSSTDALLTAWMEMDEALKKASLPPPISKTTTNSNSKKQQASPTAATSSSSSSDTPQDTAGMEENTAVAAATVESSHPATTSSSSSHAKTTAADLSMANWSSHAVLPWPGTRQPCTLPGIPLLLSALAAVPEKSVACSTAAMFDSKETSMLWWPSHLPSLANVVLEKSTKTEEKEKENDKIVKDANVVATTEQQKAQDNKDDIVNTGVWVDTAKAQEIKALQREVAVLQSQLEQERVANLTCMTETAQWRNTHNEWVAMMALVRQETEAILHRHNVLSESHMARAAVAAQQEEEDDEEEEEDEDEIMEDDEHHHHHHAEEYEDGEEHEEHHHHHEDEEDVSHNKASPVTAEGDGATTGGLGEDEMEHPVEAQQQQQRRQGEEEDLESDSDDNNDEQVHQDKEKQNVPAGNKDETTASKQQQDEAAGAQEEPIPANVNVPVTTTTAAGTVASGGSETAASTALDKDSNITGGDHLVVQDTETKEKANPVNDQQPKEKEDHAHDGDDEGDNGQEGEEEGWGAGGGGGPDAAGGTSSGHEATATANTAASLPAAAPAGDAPAVGKDAASAAAAPAVGTATTDSAIGHKRSGSDPTGAAGNNDDLENPQKRRKL